MNLKRAFDVVVASAVGIIVSPVVLLTGAVMTVAHGGAVTIFYARARWQGRRLFSNY